MGCAAIIVYGGRTAYIICDGDPARQVPKCQSQGAALSQEVTMHCLPIRNVQDGLPSDRSQLVSGVD